MEAARTSETSVDNYFTRQYNPEDSSEHQRGDYSLPLISKQCVRKEIGKNNKLKGKKQWIKSKLNQIKNNAKYIPQFKVTSSTYSILMLI
jgi:hypothetical protein